MATCGVDGSIRLWQVRNGMLLRSFIGHEKEVKNSILDVNACSDSILVLWLKSCIFPFRYGISRFHLTTKRS